MTFQGVTISGVLRRHVHLIGARAPHLSEEWPEGRLEQVYWMLRWRFAQSIRDALEIERRLNGLTVPEPRLGVATWILSYDLIDCACRALENRFDELPADRYFLFTMGSELEDAALHARALERSLGIRAYRGFARIAALVANMRRS